MKINPPVHGLLPVLFLLSTVALTMSGCAGANTPGDLGVNQKTLATCPSRPPAAQAAIDVSGTDRMHKLPEAYTAATRDLVRRTAVCDGHLSVVAFSASSTATVSLFEGDLRMPGSTENSRLRRVPQATEDVMRTVEEAYATKISSITPGGTDILAQYRLASEGRRQLGGDRPLDLLILTDGFQNAGLVIGDRVLSDAEAKTLATDVDVPLLPGATITVAGIGKTSDQAVVATDVVNGMKAFYEAICQRTGAATCVSVTDYTPAGG
ncbi:hypothetical protein [Arthrobacter sp. 2MCAF14]|uniref:hypothetical protein n=1 Tax=Arthrobacter sp. 2MCAF14 TaxID=3232982 RepID=UPI003F931B22